MMNKNPHLFFALLFVFGVVSCNSESIGLHWKQMGIHLATGQDLDGKKAVSSLPLQNGMNSLKNMPN